MWLTSITQNLVAALIGFMVRLAWDKLRDMRRRRGHWAILAGLENPLIVFPPRERVPEAVLPRISTEDFLAVNNLISAFDLAGHPAPRRLRDPEHTTDQLKKEENLIIICSSKRNPVTEQALHLLREQTPDLADLIPSCKEEASGRQHIRWNKGEYPSESYEQSGPEKDDVAMIIKARSPWAGQRRILIVSGIRRFGTWGAAEFLKKHWKEIYDRKGDSRRRGLSKQGNFVALISVRYANFDITQLKLLHLIDLDGFQRP